MYIYIYIASPASSGLPPPCSAQILTHKSSFLSQEISSDIYTYMCIYIYTCVYIYIYIYICVSVYIYMCVCLYLYIYMYKYIYCKPGVIWSTATVLSVAEADASAPSHPELQTRHGHLHKNSFPFSGDLLRAQARRHLVCRHRAQRS